MEAGASSDAGAPDAGAPDAESREFAEHWAKISEKHIAERTRDGYERNGRVFITWLRDNGLNELATNRNVLLEELSFEIFKQFMSFM